MDASGPCDFDLRTVSWEYHPVLRAIETNRLSSLRRMIKNQWFKKLGSTSIHHARTLKGESCLTYALSKSTSFKDPKLFLEFISLLLGKFGAEPNIRDRHGRSALSYAVLHSLDLGVIKLLLPAQTKQPEVEDVFSLPLLYASVVNRHDIAKLILSKAQPQTVDPLCKFISLNDTVFTPRLDHLDIPYMLDGSPKRYTPFSDSPVNGTLVNGIRFRLSPSSSSPSCSSGAVSPSANMRNPNVSLASSENSKTSSSSLYTRPGLNHDLTGRRSMRRISSGLFETELSSNTAVTFMVPLAQLVFNLSVYVEACSSDAHTSRLPDPFTDERHEIPSEGFVIIDSALLDSTKQGVDDGDEKAAIMVGIEAATRRKSSAPILIKSRSVEAAMNSRKPQKASADQLSFCVMPRDVRKNALQSSHLIERQGSAPQLMLKRKPKGLDDDGSLGSSPVGSPVTGLSRCGTRQQILTKASSLRNSALTHYMQD